MDLHEALRTRRTGHTWLPDPVPDAVIDRALEAAHLAPCHKHTWPWRFTVVGPRARAQLVEQALALKASEVGGPLVDAQREAVRRKVGGAGALVAVSQVRHDDPVRAREDYAAVACAIQNLSLSVHADGFHAKWATGALTRTEETYLTLGVDPAREELVGFVWIGRAAPPPEVRRPPVADVVRRLP